MKVTISALNIKGTNLKGVNPLPSFRDRNTNTDFVCDETFTAQDKEGFGYSTGFRVLPYGMQDRYDRNKKDIALKTITLENDKLKATFMVEQGARLYSLVRKSDNRELLFKNPVYQPANLASRNAWFSGGVEFNCGQYGHTSLTCDPVFAAKMTDDKGNEFVRFYEYERIKKLFYYMDFHLPKGAEVLTFYTRIVNIYPHAIPAYWWTNTAVVETPKTRVLAPAEEVICISFEPGFPPVYMKQKMPYLTTAYGEDASYPMTFTFANEYFFQIPESVKSPWEATAYENGDIWFERSTNKLRFRKMFCWGNHVGGNRWKDYLSNPGEGAYVEVQAGFSPSQCHGTDIPANTAWEFTTCIGGSNISPEAAHDKDWYAACDNVSNEIDKFVDPDQIYELQKECQKYIDVTPECILHMGAGFGAIEAMRLAKEGKSLPKAFNFPKASISDKEIVWASLLETNEMPQLDINEAPPSWMVDSNFIPVLQNAIKDKKNQTWDAYLHLGVMLYENMDEAGALEAFNNSVAVKPNAWAYRNLAKISQNKGDIKAAVELMDKAIAVSGSYCDIAFAEEHLDMLNKDGQFRRAWEMYKNFPEQLKNGDRMQITAAVAAIELDDQEALDYVDSIFVKEFAVIREGEIIIVDLWFKSAAKKLAKERGVAYNEEILAEARDTLIPPEKIDMRLNTKKKSK